MAEGLLRLRYGGTYEVFSAGTQPTEMHPLVAQVMNEIDVDVSAQQSESLERYLDQPFDAVVTTCDHVREVCPIFPGARRTIHKGFSDPSTIDGPDQDVLDAFRRTRDEIDAWILETFEPRTFGSQ